MSFICRLLLSQYKESVNKTGAIMFLFNSLHPPLGASLRSSLRLKRYLSKPSYSIYSAILLCSMFMVPKAQAINPPNPDLNPNPQVPASIDGCPNYRGALDLPSLNGPDQRNFQRWDSRFWSRHHSPYHMVHDEIVNPGESITITGKFDYDRVFHKDLEQEYVHAYVYGTGMNQWSYLGRHKTDWDGKVYVDVPAQSEGEYIVRMIVEGDLSSADGFISVVPRGQETVLFDIDGTLTLNDAEQIGDYLGVSQAGIWPYAKQTVQNYLDKGYRVIFLTARPYWNARDTREWFTRFVNLPQWQLRTNENGGGDLFNIDIEGYKRDYLTRIQRDKGLNIIRAYGNANSDINAYLDSGIDLSNIWIIGENAGNQGTQPIHGDYSAHFFSVVESTPVAACRR